MAKKTGSEESQEAVERLEKAKESGDEDEIREAGRDQLYGGRVEVIANRDGLIYEGETYDEGDTVEMNKQDAVDAVRHGACHYPTDLDEEEREADTEKLRAKKAARRAKKGKK